MRMIRLLAVWSCALAATTIWTPANRAKGEDMASDRPAADKDNGVVLHPAPEGEKASDLYSLRVNGRAVFVYEARVSARPVNRAWPGHQRPLDQTEAAAFAYWDMSRPVRVEVVSARPAGRVVVRPLSLGIKPEVKGGTISFRLDEPRFVTVEVGGIHHALHLFPSRPLVDAPRPGAARVRHFGPGVHRAGVINLASGETVHIAGGAVVHGLIHASGAKGIKVTGRGILDASTVKRTGGKNMLWFEDCRDVAVSGIILRDPHVWAAKPTNCDGVRFSNVKLIGCWRYNSDGFDFVDCRDVRVRNCFVRSFDDSIVVKSFGARPIRDILVEDCVIWTDWGVSLGITYETRTDRITDVTFRNCDVIHNIACRAALTINPSDRAEISNVRFEDIRLEDARSGLIELVVEKTQYGKDEQRGHIRGVHFRNVTVVDGPFPASQIRGYDEAHAVEDVTIENLVIHGRRILDAAAGRFRIGPHASNVRFAPAGGARGQ